MAISPPTDIVMDVLRAADPQAVEVARARLQNGGPAPATTETFLAAAPARPSPVAAPADEAAPFRKFEAMVLGTFLESMLPAEAGEAYGGGYAGDMWKSMLAREMGSVIAERGGVGLADRILPNHYREGKETVPLAGAGPVGLDERNILSTALVQEFERRATGEMTGAVANDEPAA